MTEPIWRPSAERVAASHLQRFLSLHRQKLETEDYAGLHHWSVADPEAFWAALWDYFEIRSSAPYTSVVDDIHAMPGATWFDGAAMNYAENLLRPQYDGVALIAYTETGRRITKNRLGRRCETVPPAARMSSTNRSAGPSRMGTSGPSTSMKALSTPRPYRAAIKCSTVPMVTPSAPSEVANLVLAT